MILIAACILAILAFANYRISRSVLYPPVLFCFLWSVTLLLFWTCSTLFDPVGPEGLYIYIIGAVAYSTGALAVWIGPKFRSSSCFGAPGHNRRTGSVFVVLLISILVALPFLIAYTRTMAYNSSSDSFWEGVRSSYMKLDHVQGGGPITVANLTPIYLVLAFIAILELTANPRHRYRRTLLLFIGFVFMFLLLSVSRSYILELLCGVVAIVAICRDRLPIKNILLSALVFLSVFVINQFVLKKMDAEWSGQASERVASIGRGFTVYAVGSLVAFDQVIRHPGHVQNTWKIYKPFVHIANKFGADLPELGQSLDFTDIGPGLDTNTYTFYFTYYVDFGIPGVLIASFMFGGLSTAVYRMARSKSPMGIVLFPLVVYGILMSAFGECVFLEVMLWVKAALCVVFFYRLLPSTSVQAIPKRYHNHHLPVGTERGYVRQMRISAGHGAEHDSSSRC
jgi:oligosaccharide repeat unit polymerase